MDKISYTALSGMRATMAAQTVTANNLANASTTGFRRDFSTTIAAAIHGSDNKDSRILTNETAMRADFSEGMLMTTGRSLDVALGSGNFLSVQAANGEEVYTRRGDLKIAPSGALVNGDGRPVLGTEGPITLPPAARIEIQADGGIAILPEGAPPEADMEVVQLKLVTPDPEKLERGADTMFRLTEGQVEADPAARLASGQLEGSNVDSSEELVNLLEQARQFELQVGILTTARDLDQSSASLLRQD